MNFVNDRAETYIAKQNYVCIPFDYSLLKERYYNHPITILSVSDLGYIDHVVVFDSILLYKLFQKELDTFTLRSVADLSLQNSLSDRSQRYLNRLCFKLYNKTKGIQINNKNQKLYIVLDLNKIQRRYRYYESGEVINSEENDPEEKWDSEVNESENEVWSEDESDNGNESEAWNSESESSDSVLDNRHYSISDSNGMYNMFLLLFYIFLFCVSFINI